MSDDISSKVKKIVADHLGIDEAKVTEESSFIDDLGADSLDTVELVMALEEEFETEIPDEEAEKLNVSYTTGGVTISATQYNFENRGNDSSESATTGDHSRWALSASFAF